MPNLSPVKRGDLHIQVPLTRRVRGTAAVMGMALVLLTAVAACTGQTAPGAAGPTGTAPSSTAREVAHLAAPVQTQSQTPMPQAKAMSALAGLPVANPRSMGGYRREAFPHWADQGAGCDTRSLVLKRDGTQVKSTATCKITSGSWYSPYDGKTIRNPREIDIDHMVPLANAWRSGADSWGDAKRAQFANDLVRPQLLAVSAAANRDKSDKDPSRWQPPNRAFWCQYAQDWITVKNYWRLTITSSEKAGLATMLRECS